MSESDNKWAVWTDNEVCQKCKHLLAIKHPDTEYPCDMEQHPNMCVISNESLKFRIDKIKERVEDIYDGEIRSRQVEAIVQVIAEGQLDYDEVNKQLSKAVHDREDHESSESTLERRVSDIEFMLERLIELITHRKEGYR